MLGMMMVSAEANEITTREQVVISEDETIYNTYQQYLAHYYLTYSTLVAYLEGEELPYHTCVNNADQEFRDTVAAWRVVNMDVSDLVEYTTKEIDFYQLIIFDILYQELSEDSTLNNISTAVNALQSSLIKDLAERGENWALDTEITEENAEQLLKQIIVCDDVKFLAKEINTLKKGIKHTKTVEDLINKLYMLIELKECSGEINTILMDLYNNATDPLMKQACRDVAWVSAKGLTEEGIIAIFGGDVFLQEISKFALDAVWKGIMASNQVFDAATLGQAVGKLAMDLWCSTSKIVENWYSMDQVYKFEKVLKEQVLVYKKRYESDPTYDNAVVFNKAANMYLNTLSVGMEYAIKYIEEVKGGGFKGFIYKNFTNKDEYDLLMTKLRAIKGNLDYAILFINNETYNLYLEELEARDSVMVVWIKTPCDVTEEMLDEQKENVSEYIFQLTNQKTESDTIYEQDKLTYANYYHENGTLDLAGRTLTVYGDFYLNGGTLNVNGGTLDVRGDMYVKGKVSAEKGNVNVGGDLIQSGGEIRINKGTLNVSGNYYMATPVENSDGGIEWGSCSSKLLMNYDEDRVTVNGDFYMHTSAGRKCEFTAGLLAVAGNFTQKYKDPAYIFSSSGTHVVMLNGKEQQHISLEADASKFATMKIENERGIAMNGYISIDSLISSKEKISVVSDGMELLSVAINVTMVEIKGDVVKNKGTLSLCGNEMQIDGNLIQLDGVIELEKGVLKVNGSYYMATAVINSEGETVWDRSEGTLLMNDEEDTIVIVGDFYMYTSAGRKCEFTAGLLAVAGNFTQRKNDPAYQFSASGSHKVMLYGMKNQAVSLDYKKSHFNILQITEELSKYTFNHESCWSILEENQSLSGDCKLTYFIIYDANGGYNEPEEQVKVYGIKMTLRESTPDRMGYIFLGWSTNPESSTAEYQPGDEFTIDKNSKLYAIWEKEPEEPHEHTYTIFETIEATCTEQGTITYICTSCGNKYADVIQAKEHIEEENPRNKIDANCTQDGYSGDIYCVGCGQVMQTGEIIKASHRWKIDSVDTTTTCSEKGQIIYKCLLCNEIKIESTRYHHNTILKNQYDATCTKLGYSGDVFCNDCDKTISRGKIIAPIGHEWEIRAVIQKNVRLGMYMNIFICKICNAKKMSIAE